ncbi:MAG TPA: molybdopterin cofactor-binding domain-containing protein [Candidatus Limnocylindria bacterium]|nr:molybdopterin cofactor-binding domain-containing protein [Candidatus Limnocylindria bacterium]
MTAVSRSNFLSLAASFAGSLVLAAGIDVCTKPLEADAAADFVPNIWLRVHPDDTVTVYLNKTEMGQGVATGLPTLIADEMDVPLTRVHVEFAPAGPQWIYPASPSQVSTGGSTSMRDSWLPLRRAGASARAMLVRAAAQRWNVPAAQLRTEDGAVIDPQTNRRATYGSLVADAAALPVPSSVALKTPQEYRLIGKTDTRTDIPSKVDGSAHFGMDVKVPGMRYAAIARSPVFGGRVRSYDASKAKAVPGVIEVVRISNGVAVVAHHTWAAFQGRDALVVEWDEGENAHVDTADLFAGHERVARDRSQWRVALQRGNAEGAHGKAVEALYHGPFLSHAPMEPMNATAHVRENDVIVWAPMQNLTRVQAAVAKITGFPPERCHITTTLLGGGFGRRLQSDFVEEAVEVSKAIKTPVKVVWTREDDMQHDFYRPMGVNAVRGVLDEHGNVVALTHTVVSESIRHIYAPAQLVKEHGRDDAALNGVTDMPYTRIPNYTAAYAEYEHGIPVGSYRAPDANWNTFVMESFVDELAHAAGKDPVAFRLAMMPPDSFAAECLREAAKRGNWGKPRPGTHQGVAVMAWNGSVGALVADVAMVDKMPQVKHVTAVVHCGTVVNPGIVAAQTRGAIMYGLSAALAGKITIKNGRVEQSNFDSYLVAHMKDTPSIDVHALPSEAPPTGIGELGLPGIAPAVAGAVFAATGKRVRSQPFSDALA